MFIQSETISLHRSGATLLRRTIGARQTRLSPFADFSGSNCVCMASVILIDSIPCFKPRYESASLKLGQNIFFSKVFFYELYFTIWKSHEQIVMVHGLIV